MTECVVGYERPGPWLLGQMSWRSCLECYLPVPGQEATPLTRERVEAERREYCEQGEHERVPHRDWRGSALTLCWVCGKDLVSGKRPRKRQIDGLTIAQRVPYQLRHILAQHP